MKESVFTQSRAMSHWAELALRFCFGFCGLLCVLCVGFICVFLFAGAVPSFSEIGFINFLFGPIWQPNAELYGIAPMIVGSVYVTAFSLIVSVPLGVLSALYLAFFAPTFLKRILTPAVELLAGIPSIVYGFFGLIVLVPFLSQVLDTSGKGILCASLLLGIMILPTIILMAKVSLESVDKSYLEGGLGLGISKERVVVFIMLKAAKSGVLASIILGAGRAIGEAMAVIVVAGNQPIFPQSIRDGVRTLTTNIVLELGYAADSHRLALIASCAVLFVFILGINLCFNAFKKGSYE